MFDPRKLIPLSIELCNAPIAVITEITENTPTVIPNIVNAARSLFAPSDDDAAEQTERRRFDQELKQNRAAPRAEGFARADLFRPLFSAHERDVHDADR